MANKSRRRRHRRRKAGERIVSLVDTYLIERPSTVFSMARNRISRNGRGGNQKAPKPESRNYCPRFFGASKGRRRTG